MKKRVTYLDLAKGVGIILVVLGHMENIDVSIRTWISSFHMPLFFIISGMLIALKSEDKYIYFTDDNNAPVGKDAVSGLSSLIKKKAKGILVPYFWFSLLYIPIDIMNLYINNVDEHTFVQNILDSATLSGISVMWFLPALFMAEITALFILEKSYHIPTRKKSDSDIALDNDKQTTKNIKQKFAYKAVAVAIALIISIVSFIIWGVIRPTYEATSSSFVICTLLGFVRVILRGIGMSFHVLLGYMAFAIIEWFDLRIVGRYKKNYEGENSGSILVSNSIEGKILRKRTVEEKAQNEVRGLSLAAGVILSVINIGLCLKNGAVDNHFMIANNLLLYYMCAFLGSLGLILICKGFDSFKSIEFLGRNSLIIMATHLQCYILYAGILIAISIDVYVTRAKSYVYMFNSVLFTMLIESVLILIINKWFPFVIGKGSVKDFFRFSKKNSN